MRQAHLRSLGDETDAKQEIAQGLPVWEKVKSAVRDIAHMLGLSQEQEQHAMAGAMGEAAGRGSNIDTVQVAQKNIGNVMGLPQHVLAQAMEVAAGARAVIAGQTEGTHMAIAQPAQVRGVALI